MYVCVQTNEATRVICITAVSAIMRGCTHATSHEQPPPGAWCHIDSCIQKSKAKSSGPILYSASLRGASSFVCLATPPFAISKQNRVRPRLVRLLLRPPHWRLYDDRLLCALYVATRQKIESQSTQPSITSHDGAVRPLTLSERTIQ